MSHSRQRKDKICLNCNADLHGRFCHVCGQENIEPKESAWSLVTHFFNDITHFDGKFFSTLKYLLFKPAFLSKEYIRGRRASYLHPIRMYVFTSAMFFIYFFSQVHVNSLDLNINSSAALADTLSGGLEQGRREMLQKMGSKGDSAIVDGTVKEFQRGLSEVTDSISSLNSGNLAFAGMKYRSVAEYDSIQRSLPSASRDGKKKREQIIQKIHNREKFRDDPQGALTEMANELLHKFPQLLFISLPFFALLLKLLYFRRKDIYYAEHGIFSIHLYIFTFIAIFFILLAEQVKDAYAMSWLRYIEGAILLLMTFYNYKAMRNFYQQGGIRTFVKLMMLYIMSAMLIFALFLGFVFLAIYEI